VKLSGLPRIWGQPLQVYSCTADAGILGFRLGQRFQPADSPRPQASTAA
jgi:hypothetical protein